MGPLPARSLRDISIPGRASRCPRNRCQARGPGTTWRAPRDRRQEKATSRGRRLKEGAEGARPGWGQGCCLSLLPGLDRALRYPTYNLQANEGSRVGPQDIGAGGQGDPGRREGHRGVRGRRDCRSAGRHAAAATSPRTAATASRARPASASRAWPPPPPPIRSAGPGRAERGEGVATGELPTEPRPVTWAQVSAPPPWHPQGSPGQVRCAPVPAPQLSSALQITCCPCAQGSTSPTGPSHPKSPSRSSPTFPSWAGRQRL